MNKDLIELQKGSPATAVVVFDSDISQLENKVILEVENKKNISKATLNFVSN